MEVSGILWNGQAVLALRVAVRSVRNIRVRNGIAGAVRTRWVIRGLASTGIASQARPGESGNGFSGQARRVQAVKVRPVMAATVIARQATFGTAIRVEEWPRRERLVTERSGRLRLGTLVGDCLGQGSQER